jgi:hypothetical protein
LLPFSLEEVSDDLAARSPTVRAAGITERFERHAVVGGYPEAWLSGSPGDVLADLTEAVVLRDASDRFRIARPDVFRRLLHLVAGQVGSLVNHAEWAALLGVSRDTVAAYVALLEESHVLVTLPPFAGGKRSELTRQPKVYFTDPGLRNHLVGSLQPFRGRPDRGPLFELWVFSELWKRLPPGATLHYWRSTSGAETDFVIVLGDRPIGVEVKAQELTRPLLPRASRSFIEAYDPKDFLMVNLALEREERVAETRVRFVTPAGMGQALAEALEA